MLLSTASLIAFTAAPASAADLAVAAPVYTKAPMAVVATVNEWTGLYIGLNAGGAWGTSHSDVAVTSPGDFFAANCFPDGGQTCWVNTVDVSNAARRSALTNSGFAGGGQIGYNWQVANTVWGIEADINSFNLSMSGARTVATVNPNAGTVTVSQSMSTNWLATIRGRFGVLVAPQALLYATGGAAVTSMKSGWTYGDTRWGNNNAADFSNTQWGWTAGVGAEYKLSHNWSIGAEYLYVKFDNVSNTTPVYMKYGSAGPASQNFTQTTDLDAQIVRAKVNYHF